MDFAPAANRTIRMPYLLLGAVLLVATRMPLLVSLRCFPDGDEAIVGLMARGLVDRGEFPGFFWGQCYGLATLEAGIAAVGFRAFGVSGVALKGAAFAIFAGGWLAWSVAAERILGRRAGILASILLAATPAWFAFSMKAWGGMVTAFAASGATLYLLAPRVGPSRVPSSVRLGMAGALVSLTWFAQPLAAIALAPILLAREIRPRGLWKIMAFAVPAGLLAWLVASACDPRDAYWRPDLFAPSSDLSNGAEHAVVRVARGALVASSGAHFMGSALQTPVLARISGGLFLAVGIAFAIAALIRSCRTRFFPFEAAASSAALALCVVTALMKPGSFMPRYLIPAAVPLALVASIRLARWGRVSGPAAWFAAFLAVGTAWTMRDLSFSGWTVDEERAIPRIVDELHSRGIRRALVTHPTLQWNLQFAGDGTLLARWRDPRDRRPDIAEEVTGDLETGGRVALVGRRGEFESPSMLDFGPFIVMETVTPAQARALGFR